MVRGVSEVFLNWAPMIPVTRSSRVNLFFFFAMKLGKVRHSDALRNVRQPHAKWIVLAGSSQFLNHAGNFLG